MPQSFLVLSGGFGSCPYLRNCIKERYETPTHLWPEGIKVLTVDEPYYPLTNFH